MVKINFKKGFSLQELLVVIGILAIMATAAVYSMSRYSPYWKIRTSARQLITAMRQAQQSSVTDQLNYKFRCYIDLGYCVTVRINADGTVTTVNVIKLASGVTFDPSQTNLPVCLKGQSIPTLAKNPIKLISQALAAGGGTATPTPTVSLNTPTPTPPSSCGQAICATPTNTPSPTPTPDPNGLGDCFGFVFNPTGFVSSSGNLSIYIDNYGIKITVTPSGQISSMNYAFPFQSPTPTATGPIPTADLTHPAH